tara:strand:- start:114649 stop:114885 length:237 start_codon:yes stop_codon:yes gene_type:complete
MIEISSTESVGYLAMVLVVSSFIFKDITKLRIINLFGAVAFIIYGFMLDIAWPVIFTNSIIIAIQVYHLIKAKKSTDE